MVLFKFLIFLNYLIIFGGAGALELGHLHSERITGGDVAHENQFPYQVGLSIEFAYAQYTWCGGSLIAPHWIITAAHCVDNILNINAYLGSVNRLEPATLIKLNSSSVHIHQDWNNYTLANDIALLFLPAAIAYNESIQPITLPRISVSYPTYAYHEAIATGWGRMSDSSPLISNELRFVVRYVETNAECQHVYGNSIRSSNLCIDTTGGRSTCTGDSGGPLVVYDTSDGKILIGLTSFGKNSGCTNGNPAVFTRITSYLEWIQAISGIANIKVVT